MTEDRRQVPSYTCESGSGSEEGRSDPDEELYNDGSNEAGEDSSSAAKTDVNQPEHSMQTSAVALVNYPCLIGRLVGDGTNHRCAGQWAMSKEAHATPSLTSPFEFRLVQAASSQVRHQYLPHFLFRTRLLVPSSWPVSGKYVGWFFIKQLPPKHPLRIDDREITLIFEKSDSGYSVNGFGLNKFGRFSMSGTMTESGEIELFRIYQVKKTGQGRGGTKRAKRVASTLQTAPPVAPVPLLPRRQSRNDTNDLDKQKPEVTRPPILPPEKPKPQRTLSPNEQNGDRPKRMKEHMKRCSDILKLLQKHPHSLWFREAVDPTKLGIPDYFDIIKEPMDFGTIQLKLEMQEYDTPESFAEHMRLVFRNAVTYNSLRTSPVHVAARELAAQFEDKYRMMISQLGSSGIDKYSRKAKSKGASRQSQPSGPIAMDETFTRTRDPNMIVEMQRRMEEMQRTISRLQTEMKNKDKIQSNPGVQLEPLTFEEKRILIQHINKLSPENLERVVEIVKDALPSSSHTDEDEDVEIPLDSLDTFTLRKLQSYVEMCTSTPSKRKHPPLARQSSTAYGAAVGTEVAEKRLKPSEPTQNGSDGQEGVSDKTLHMGFVKGLNIPADASGTDDSDDEQNESDFSPALQQSVSNVYQSQEKKQSHPSAKRQRLNASESQDELSTGKFDKEAPHADTDADTDTDTHVVMDSCQT